VADYTTTTQVKRWLPSNYSSTTLPDSTISSIIRERSAYVDDSLPRYWEFNSVTDSPATPKLIQEITTWLVAHECLHILGMSDRFGEGSLTWRLREWAEDRLEKLRRGELRISPETKTETMTFGTDPLDDDEFLTGIAPKEIIPQSIQISGYELDEDFQAYYSHANRGWIIRRLTSDITDGTSVTYDWTYLKQREIDTLPVRVGVVYRG
jgi:hypothetical protein